MRALFAFAALVAIAATSAASAQTAPTPGMGATSPLGTMNFNASSGPVGIPLGSTELDTGGTSPLPGVTPCAVGTTASTGVFDGGATSIGSGMGSSTTGSSFDGGGSSLGSAVASSCSTTGTAASLPLASTPSAGLQLPGSAGNTIPLGSVELTSPGVSPLVGVPAPGIGTSTCGSTSTMGGAGISPGSTSFGC